MKKLNREDPALIKDNICIINVCVPAEKWDNDKGCYVKAKESIYQILDIYDAIQKIIMILIHHLKMLI